MNKTFCVIEQLCCLFNFMVQRQRLLICIVLLHTVPSITVVCVVFWVCLSISSGEKELPPGSCQKHLVDDRLPKQLLFGELQKT